MDWKKNDAGMPRGKEEEGATKEKMDGWDTWSNWNETGGTKRHDDRKETMEKACHDGRQLFKELTAQGDKVNFATKLYEVKALQLKI